MLAVIAACKSGAASLCEAAGSLSFLHSSLEHAEEGWELEFVSHIVTLDSVGTASDDQVRQMGDGYRATIDETLARLGEMVREVLPAQVDDDID
jgi:hypothetical protein